MASKLESEVELLRICCEELKEEEKDGFSKLQQLITNNADISIDAIDKDGMTSLMHAAFCGHFEACQLLLNKGADVNNNSHKEGYTALMFATVAGHPIIVDLLLRNGAKIDSVNKIGRTAAQLGGFVGQHEAVQVINNYFSIDDLQYYTITQGFEKTPKLDPILLNPLHLYISTVNLNPVGLLLLVQSSSPCLLDHTHMICNLLNILCEKAIKEENEQFSIKLHYLSFALKEFSKYESTNPILKSLLLFSDEGLPLEMERFLRQSLKCFPHTYSLLLKQIVATLAKIPLGESPNTLSVFSTYLLGNRTYDEQIHCSTCGISNSVDLKKCSKCTKVYYCGTECQKLAWTLGNHKRLCKKWSKAATVNKTED